MTSTRTRAGATIASLAALTLLAGCTTTVEGAGRPGAAGGGGFPSSSSSSGSSGSSASPSGSSGGGSVDANGDPHDVWDSVVDASSSTGGTVKVTGTITGAGVSGATIAATYSTGSDDQPVARATVTIDKGTLEVIATGGKAWAKSSAAVYEEYGYDDAGSAQADGKEVVITDDDSGLDVYTALETFLSLCGPDAADPASLDDGQYEGKDVVVVNDEKYDTKAYVDPATGRILASVYQGETVTFDYSDSPTSVDAPPADQVVSVDGF